MFVKNTAVALTWDLAPTGIAAAYLATYYDLQITEPDGVITYSEGAVVGATFVAPTSTVAGTLALSYTFLKAGLYQLALCTGTAAGTVVLSKRTLLIVEADVAQRIAVTAYV